MIAGVLLIIILIPRSGYAHRPYIADDKYDSAQSALQVEDPAISIAVYKRVTCEAPQLWLTFEAEAGQEIYLSVGVPVLDRLEDYRPALALLGPGLPAPSRDLPFAVPEGMGVQVFDTEQVREPELFYEPYSMTSSWILLESRVPVPSAGRYFLVAWAPSQTTGKLWVAVGEIEDFSGVDPAELAMLVERVKEFHEIEGYAPEQPPVETVCATADSGCGGCDAITPGALLPVMFALLLLRRRSRAANPR